MKETLAVMNGTVAICRGCEMPLEYGGISRHARGCKRLQEVLARKKIDADPVLKSQYMRERTLRVLNAHGYIGEQETPPAEFVWKAPFLRDVQVVKPEMTVDRATEVLNGKQHRSADGKSERDQWRVNGEFVYGPDRYDSFDHFEAIAIAEKYEREAK